MIEELCGQREDHNQDFWLDYLHTECT
jgi:hypothetical protein